MSLLNLPFLVVSKQVCSVEATHYLLVICSGVERPPLKISLALLLLKTSHCLANKISHNLINNLERICLGLQSLLCSLDHFSKPHNQTHFSVDNQICYSAPPSLVKAVYLATKPVYLGPRLT
jgi:hypothetical protein